MSKPMAGRTCVVTGASSGIGKATAMGLAKLGAEVILACRDQARREAACAEVRAASGNPAVSLMLVDLSSQASIRSFAQAYHASGKPLHVLINNAAAIPRKRTLTVDGIEAQLATNHLGAFLLTNLLLDVLSSSAPARIVNISSKMHADVALALDDLQSERQYKFMKVYKQTKLMNLYFTFELARRLRGTGVTVNALHPGVVATEIGRDVPLFRAIAKLFFVSPEEGARTPTYVASSPDVEGLTGHYFADQREAEPSVLSRDPEIAQRLWELSAQLTKLDQARVAA